MGVVYRAFDTLLHRRVALKVLHSMPRDPEPRGQAGPPVTAGEARGPTGGQAVTAGNAAEASPTLGQAGGNPPPAGPDGGATRAPSQDARGRPTSGDGEPLTDRILREARAAAAIDHPNAVAIFDIGEHEGVCFIAMELVAGRPLRDLVGAPDIPVERRLRWLADVARALAAAHRVGVVHLDVKPENVMVGDDDRVKVLDFGIARQVLFDDDPGAPTATLTGTGNVAGTPAYMAPEQVRRLGIDSRTDQFSWGVVAYELLCGKMPWSQTRSLFNLFSCIVHEAPPSLRESNPDIPEDLDALVSRAMSKPPADRFPTMVALLEALEGPAPPSQDRTSLAGVAPPRSGSSSVRIVPNPAATTLPVPTDPTPAPPPSEPTPPTTDPTSPRRRPSRPSPSRAAVVLLGVLLAAVLGVWVVRRPAPEPARVTLTDLPLPEGCNAAALTEYRAGIQAQHDGDWEEARGRFEAATRADPDCAGAHLRLALAADYTLPSARIREVYQRAVQLRSALSKRDRLFLDAMDPLVRRDPSDVREFTARVAPLAKQWPGDAELVYLAGYYSDDPEVKMAQARAALAIDPNYSDAYQSLAAAQKKLHRLDDALATLDTCVRIAPSSTDCVSTRVDIHRLLGQCSEVVEDARLWIARAPRSTNGYYTLAYGLAGQGAPASAVEEALRQRWSRLPDAALAYQQPLEEAALDALEGRFDRAEAEARAVERLVDTDPSYAPHAQPALLLVDLDLELGRFEQAATRAADFLGRRGVWSATLLGGSLEVRTYHLEPLLLDAERRGKKLTPGAWRAARDAWLTATRRSGLLDEGALWAVGVAMAAETPEEATEAVRSMPPSLRAGWGTTSPRILSTGMYVGRALLLAGEVDAAIPFLRRTAGHCDALVIPFEDTQAHRWLGRALEKSGDVAGACAAYQVVDRRWGEASPAPESATFAKDRRAALGCPP